MIHIKETFPDEKTVIIHVDGRLDKQTLAPLEMVFNRYAKSSKILVFSLEGLMSVSKEGCRFFQGIKDRVTLTGLNEFLKLELVG